MRHAISGAHPFLMLVDLADEKGGSCPIVYGLVAAMAKARDSRDSRSYRDFLPDEAFLLVSGKRPGPIDLVSEKVWSGIMDLPDDVVANNL
jgi:hypothetical protein